MGVAVFQQLSLVKSEILAFLITSTCYKILSFLQIFFKTIQRWAILGLYFKECLY